MEHADEDLAALNELVQIGLAEIVEVNEGEPSYRLASRFTAEGANLSAMTQDREATQTQPGGSSA